METLLAAVAPAAADTALTAEHALAADAHAMPPHAAPAVHAEEVAAAGAAAAAAPIPAGTPVWGTAVDFLTRHPLAVPAAAVAFAAASAVPQPGYAPADSAASPLKGADLAATPPAAAQADVAGPTATAAPPAVPPNTVAACKAAAATPATSSSSICAYAWLMCQLCRGHCRGSGHQKGLLVPPCATLEPLYHADALVRRSSTLPAICLNGRQAVVG